MSNQIGNPEVIGITQDFLDSYLCGNDITK